MLRVRMQVTHAQYLTQDVDISLPHVTPDAKDSIAAARACAAAADDDAGDDDDRDTITTILTTDNRV